ncbi:MAG: DUF547 domain-containing protein [Myxococcota bacterium]
MRHPRLRALAAALACLASAVPGAARAADLDLDLYAALLAEYTQAVDATVGTRVDYAGLGREPRWRALVASLEAATPSALPTREARLAFWINAYNVLAIDTVVAHYPVDSIRDVGAGWVRIPGFAPVWKREAARIEGRAISLDGIEHATLRPLGEPRIHGAIVCASTSCPSLAREPFRAETLDAQLDAAWRRWMADPRKGLRVDRAAMRVTTSRILLWFAEDFEAQGGPLAFAARYASDDDRAWIAAHDPALAYFDYDWSLNDWRR